MSQCLLWNRGNSLRTPKGISWGPNDICFHIIRSNDFFASFPYQVSIIELGEFEDLYYAACAKAYELLDGADIMLTNRFKTPQDIYLEYDYPPLMSIGPISLEGFRLFLFTQLKLLHSEALTSILDKGVTRKTRRDNKHQIDKERSKSNECTSQAYDEEISSVRHGIQTKTDEHIKFRHGLFERKLGWLNGVHGLRDMSNMSCGMVFAELAEKYRPMVGIPNLGNGQGTKFEVTQLIHGETTTNPYLSPYNLNERAKKLNNPDGPEMPCICDPECICAPLCASDPTQNCLCEENGLFARVTEAMDIDDLDVPDLVRRDRQASETLSSVASSTTATEGVPQGSTITMDAWHNAVGNCQDADEAIDEINDQKRKQIAQTSKGFDYSRLDEGNQFGGILSGLASSSKLVGYQHWDSSYITPPRISSLSYRDALTQPFSSLCDTPPQRISNRPSIANRLFGVKSMDRSSDKRDSASLAVTKCPHDIGKVSKFATKRTRQDIANSSSKCTFHRESRALGCLGDDKMQL